MAASRILWRELPCIIKTTLGIKNVALERWSHDLRKHRFHIMLPIYFLDRQECDRDGDTQLRVVVNG